jgi:hypothetical protein
LPKPGLDLTIVVDGAVADNGGIQTTETVEAQNTIINDVTLLPAVPAVNDAYYFGLLYLWDNLQVRITTQGVGVWTTTWEYYDADTTWHTLVGVTDNTDSFRASAGLSTVIFTRPTTWALTNVNAAGNFYWIRARVTSYTSVVTPPDGSQAWCVIKNTQGAPSTTSTWPLDWSGVAHYLGFTGTDAAFRGLIAVIGIFFITTKSAGAAIPVAFALLVGFSAIGLITPILVAGVVFLLVVVFAVVFILGKAIA